MKLTIDALQGQPSFTVCDDDGIIKAKVYACKDGTVISTEQGKYRLPIGCRTIKEQVGSEDILPATDGFEV